MSIIVCMNAGKIIIPSFCKKHFRQNYIQRCKLEATMALQEMTLMTSCLFSTWISQCIQNTERLKNISLEKQLLLIMTGHTSNVTLKVIEEAKFVGLDLLALLPHTLHALQPLDYSIFKTFKE